MRTRLMLCDARWRRSIRALLLTVAASLGSGGALAHGGGERPLATVPTPPAGDGAKAAQILREVEARVAPPPGAGQQPGGEAPRAEPAGTTTTAAETPSSRAVAKETPAAKTPAATTTATTAAAAESTAAKASATTAAAAKAPASNAAKVVAEPVAQAKRALQRAHGARVAGDAANARRLDALALEWAETARTLLRAAEAEAAAVDAAERAYKIETKMDRARALLAETQVRRGRAAAELERVEAEARAAAQAAADAEAQRIEAGKRPAVGGAKRAAPGAQRAPRAAQGEGQKGSGQAAGPAAPASKGGTP
ncbi:hypothetical protein WMF31_31015 [Sorangium sp. So ce1036]|uniref:hypothetical protein n=1 Tax=Sorangium sp. So ce1036 TaxID=3133328 RepID=UPI003F02DF94